MSPSAMSSRKIVFTEGGWPLRGRVVKFQPLKLMAGGESSHRQSKWKNSRNVFMVITHRGNKKKENEILG